MAVGLAAGTISGLFGVGGGVLIVPGLVTVLALDQRRAHGTSLAAVLPIAASGLVSFAVAGSVDWAVGAILAGGAMVGALIGTYALHKLSTTVLARTFAGIMLITAVRLVVDHSSADGRGALTLGMVLGLVSVGLASGTLAGLLGVGGGAVLVPAMIILFGLPGALAKGTSLAVIIPTSLVATAKNLRNTNIDVPVAAAVGLAGAVSSYLAANVSVGLDPRTSNLLFAALLTVMGARMLLGTSAPLTTSLNAPVDRSA